MLAGAVSFMKTPSDHDGAAAQNPKNPRTNKEREEGAEGENGASWEISALITQAWFLSPSAGIMGLAHYGPDYCLSTATAGKTSGNTLINDPAALNAAFRVRGSCGAFPVVVREFVCSSTLILEFSTLHKSPAQTGGGGGGVTEKNPTRRPSHNPPGAMSRATFEGCGALRWRKSVNLHQRATPFENSEPGGESEIGRAHV